MISTWRGEETRTAIGSHETSKGIRLAHERTALALFTGKLSFGFAVHFGTLTHGAMVRQSGANHELQNQNPARNRLGQNTLANNEVIECFSSSLRMIQSCYETDISCVRSTRSYPVDSNGKEP